MDQSELEANACNRRQAREKACKRGTTGFGFASHWLRKWAHFVNQSQSVVKQNQSKREITFDTQSSSNLAYTMLLVQGRISQNMKTCGFLCVFWLC